jgi:hypothetical protein
MGNSRLMKWYELKVCGERLAFADNGDAEEPKN